MSNVTLNSPQLAPIIAALSPEPAEPLPNEGDDVVEAYSFNTGSLMQAVAARHVCVDLPANLKSNGSSPHFTMCPSCIGLMVLMMILYASLGHKIAARCAHTPLDCSWEAQAFGLLRV